MRDASARWLRSWPRGAQRQRQRQLLGAFLPRQRKATTAPPLLAGAHRSPAGGLQAEAAGCCAPPPWARELAFACTASLQSRPGSCWSCCCGFKRLFVLHQGSVTASPPRYFGICAGILGKVARGNASAAEGLQPPGPGTCFGRWGHAHVGKCTGKPPPATQATQGLCNASVPPYQLHLPQLAHRNPHLDGVSAHRRHRTSLHHGRLGPPARAPGGRKWWPPER